MKKGFTLVELLAVIVILGLLYTFMLPTLKNMDNKKEIELIENKVINAAKEYALEFDKSFFTKFYNEGDTNYVCKDKLIQNDLLDLDEISVLDNFVAIKGVLNKEDKITYSIYYSDEEIDACKTTMVEYITNNAGNDGIEDINISYYNSGKSSKYNVGLSYKGSDPNNYIYYNCDDPNNIDTCEKWRIIGIRNVEDEFGKKENRLKIINTSSTFKSSWDSSVSDINSGYGINQWGPSGDYKGADLYQLLNGIYIGKSTVGYYCTSANCDIERTSACEDETCEDRIEINGETLKNDYNMKPLTTSALSLISNVKWSTSPIPFMKKSIMDGINIVSETYASSIGLMDISFCEGEECSDGIERIKSVVAKVGLLSAGDVLAPATDYEYYTSNNWLYIDLWTINPYERESYRVYESSADQRAAYNSFVYPTVYLNADVIRVDGYGTFESPYQIR